MLIVIRIMMIRITFDKQSNREYPKFPGLELNFGKSMCSDNQWWNVRLTDMLVCYDLYSVQ